METEPKMTQADVLAAYYAAARLVHAELSSSELAAGEQEAAMADLWTGDDAADDERCSLLVRALAEYAAILARKAAGTKAEARDEAFVQVWAMVPNEAAARALIARQLDAADALAARLSST